MTRTQTQNTTDPEHTSLADRRDDIVARVKDQLKPLANACADLYGEGATITLPTDDAEWTLQLDGNSIRYLKYEYDDAGEIYVISEYEPPEPSELRIAIQDYPAFVTAAENRFDADADRLADAEDFLANADARLEDANLDERINAIVTQHENLIDDFEALCSDLVSAYVDAVDTEYGTLTVTNETEHKWEVKYDDYGRSVEWLRVNDSTYLISQFDDPAPSTITKHLDDLEGFVDGVIEIIESQDDAPSIDYNLTITS